MVSEIRPLKTFGRTLELNPLGDKKVCSFDCVYCSLGPSEVRMSRIKAEVDFPAVDVLIETLGKVLADEAAAERKVDTILIAGNGEPTMHPQLTDLIRGLLVLRGELMPEVKLVIQTSGDRLDDRDVTDALNKLDERIVKLDVGTQRAFKSINRPLSRSTLERMILGARALKDLSIQSMVLGGKDALTQQQLDEWIEVLGMLAPQKIYLQTAKRPTAEKDVVLATDDEVARVAHWLERKLKVKAQVELDSDVESAA